MDAQRASGPAPGVDSAPLFGDGTAGASERDMGATSGRNERSGRIRRAQRWTVAYLALAALTSTPAARAADVPDPVQPESAAALSNTPSIDLDAILERRFLRVLTVPRPSDEGRVGSGSADDYSIVRAFTDYLNARYAPGEFELPIAFVLIRVDESELMPGLRAGRGDLIAAPRSALQGRLGTDEGALLEPLLEEVLIENARARAITSLEDLSGRPVAVRRHSVHHVALSSLDEGIVRSGRAPVRIIAVDPEVETEDLVALVATGYFQYALTDSAVARSIAATSPMLRISAGLPLGVASELAFETLPSAPKLTGELGDFLDRYRHGSLPAEIGVRRHVGRSDALRDRPEPAASPSLSRYDDHFKRFADRYGFDWRLLASIACQESRFRQAVTNRWGATGLFQVKPVTAREPYIGIPEIAGRANAANNVHAGVRYLNWIKERYFDPVEEMHERDRIRMALAAYNAGPRTLLRAQRLATQMGLDPTRWFRNVELAMLAMDKQEPVKYVSEINQRYLSYVMFGVE